MGLQMNRTTPQGVVCTTSYMKIIQARVYTPDRSMELTLAVYMDKASRDADPIKRPLESLTRQVPYVSTETGDLYQILYRGLKALTEFSGNTTDILETGQSA